MNLQRSRDSYSMGTHKGIYGDESITLVVKMRLNQCISKPTKCLLLEFSSLIKPVRSGLLCSLGQGRIKDFWKGGSYVYMYRCGGSLL